MRTLEHAATRFALSVVFGLALTGLAAAIAQQTTVNSSVTPTNVTTTALAEPAPDAVLAEEDTVAVASDAGAVGAPNPWLGRLTDKLGLTPDQQTQAQAVFAQARTDIKALHDQAHEQIRALLTDPQKATFDSLPKPPFAAPRGGMRGFHDGGLPGGGGAAFLNRLTERLGLTPDQVTSITAIQENLKSAIKARHDAAQTQFQALLTPDQVTALSNLRAQGPIGAGPLRGNAMFRGPGQKLGLTDAQRTQARTIFQQTRAGVKALRDQAREQVNALLTDDQNAKLNSVWPPAGDEKTGMGCAQMGARKMGGAQQGPRPGAMQGGRSPAERQQAFVNRLQQGLGLTAEQTTSVETILGTLHSSVSALRDTARQQFRALLTPEQTTTLDQMKAEHNQAAGATPE